MIGLAKTAASILSASGLALGLAYVASVPAAGVGVAAFMLGWVNGVGDALV